MQLCHMGEKIRNNMIFLLLAAAIVVAETHITGDISGMTFDTTGNPFIVEQDIMIPAGKQAVFHEGCVFLFKPFSGLHVSGRLDVEGTASKPVVFTSISDGEFYQLSAQLPNPFDWNGILIGRDASECTMVHFLVRYSVYGIKSQSRNIHLKGGLFKANGQFDFAINDQIQLVQPGISFTYNMAENLSTTPSKQSDSRQKPIKTGTKSTVSTQKNIFRYSLLGAGLIGGGFGTYFAVQAKKSYDERLYLTEKSNLTREIEKLEIRGVQDSEAAISKRYETVKESEHRNIALTVISYGLSAVCLTGFTLTFVF
jgi:hypothetical protein